MKALLACLMAIGAMLAAPVGARPSRDAGLIGRWAVDVSRMPLPPAARRTEPTRLTSPNPTWSRL